jgi:hypothetical protein
LSRDQIDFFIFFANTQTDGTCLATCCISSRFRGWYARFFPQQSRVQHSKQVQEDTMAIAESDWKKFKTLRQIALDRFCQGVLADAKAITQHGALSAHARYGMHYGLIQDRNKDMARAFDHNSQSRSSALRGLALMVMHDLLTDAELSILSEDALDYISGVVRQPYEMVWVDELEPRDW